MNKETIVIKAEKHVRTIVMLHGLGGSGESLVPLVQNYSLSKQNKLVLPTAPVRRIQGSEGGVMNAWFVVEKVGKPEITPEIKDSAEKICEILEEEAKTTENIVLGGFSQGGIMSLFTGLNYHFKPLKGVFALSSYSKNFEVKHKEVPLFLYNGDEDSMIDVKLAQETYNSVLAEANKKFYIEKGLSHKISKQEMDSLKNWLEKLA